MKKDIEWLNNEIEKIIKDVENDDVSFAGKEDYDEGYIDGIRDVQSIVNQLDEPEVKQLDNKMVIEKPTIPEFVADFLDGKEDYALYELLDSDSIYDSHDRSARWLYDNDEETNREREFSLVLAHIYDYEVEEEQKYYAKIKGHENIDSDDKYWNYCVTDGTLDIGDNKVHDDVLYEYVLSATKYDWNILGVNDDNADFVEVGELEE